MIKMYHSGQRKRNLKTSVIQYSKSYFSFRLRSMKVKKLVFSETYSTLLSWTRIIIALICFIKISAFIVNHKDLFILVTVKAIIINQLGNYRARTC